MASKYDPVMCQTLLKMMKEGKGPTQVASKLGIASSTLKSWASDTTKPEFMEAIEQGRTDYQAYWEEIGQKGILGQIDKFNAAVWIFQMRCRFREEWNDLTHQKIEVINSVEKMSDSELTTALQTFTKKLDSKKEKEETIQ